MSTGATLVARGNLPPVAVPNAQFLTGLRLCLHEKFQPGSSSARVESLYDRQKR